MTIHARVAMLSDRLWSVIAWVVGGALAAATMGRLVPVVQVQFAAPFDLISEGPHMCTVEAIQRGFNIYERSAFLDLPFFMTPYTPLYHALVAALPQDAANPFFTGRVVAATFMVAAAASLIVVARRGPLALIAIALFFLIHSVTANTVYLRSDSLALCCSIWAVVLASRARSARAFVCVGALCALAVAAKQSFVSATIACGIYVLLTAPRRLVPFIAGGAAVTLGLACVATAYWGTDFWLAVTIPMTDYPRDMQAFFAHWHMMFAQPLFVFLVATALAVTVAALVRGGTAALATPFLPYVLVSWVVQTWIMTGIGAENHNLIEPVLATLAWIVVADRAFAGARYAGPIRTAVVAILLVCVARELGNADAATFSYTSPRHTARYVQGRAAVVAALRTMGLDHGRVLNLTNSQVVHDYPGDFTVNDPWMYITVLWNSRPETATRLLAAIDREEFDAVIVSSGVLSAALDVGDHPWARVIRAVFAHYQLAFHGEEVNVLTRRRAVQKGAALPFRGGTAASPDTA